MRFHTEKQWEEWVSQGVKVMEGADWDMLVMKDQEFGMGIREWFRSWLNTAPPDALQAYRREVTIRIGERFRRALAGGDEEVARNVALRFPGSAEEEIWKRVGSQVALDEGGEPPPLAAPTGLTLSWSTSFNFLGGSLADTGLGGAAKVGDAVWVSRGVQWVVLDGATGRPRGSPDRGKVFVDARTGIPVIVDIGRALRPSQQGVLAFSLAQRVEGYGDGLIHQGILIAAGPLVGERPKYHSMMRWLVGVRWEEPVRVLWQTSVLSRPLSFGGDGELMDSTTLEEIWEKLNTGISEILVGIQNNLENPETRAATLKQYHATKDEEVWAQMGVLSEFLEEIGGSYRPPILTASGERVAAAFAQGVACVMEAGTGALAWLRKLPEWKLGDTLGLAVDRVGVYLTRPGELGGVEAFNVSSGERLWEWSKPKTPISLLGVSGEVVVVAAGSQVIGLERATGKVRWTWQGQDLWQGQGTVARGVAWVPMGPRLVGVGVRTGALVVEAKRPEATKTRLIVSGDELFEVSVNRCTRYRLLK